MTPGSRDESDVKEILALRKLNDDMLAALEEYASLMERAGRLHPSRDLREVISDPEHLAIRTRATIRRAKGEG